MATPPFNIDETKPADSDAVSAFPAVERTFRDTVEDSLAVEHDYNSAGSSARHKFGVGNNAARDAITNWVVGSIWFNTSTTPATLQRVVSVGPVVWENIGVGLSTANTWTAKQTISLTVAGDALELISTDAGAGSGPSLGLFRDSASPAAVDEIGQVDFTGRSSTGVKRTYGFLDCIIDDPTNASEDAQLRLVTMVAGTLQAALTAKAGVLIGNPAGGDKGAGTINATDHYRRGTLTHAFAQQVEDVDNTLVTSATNIPYDDTIPQNTEGVEVLSVSITPTDASSVLEIDVDVNLGGSVTSTATAALFVDTTANALQAKTGVGDASSHAAPIFFRHRLVAGSTSARTYKVRVGVASGTVAFNGNAGARKLGGSEIGRLTVKEILP